MSSEQHTLTSLPFFEARSLAQKPWEPGTPAFSAPMNPTTDRPSEPDHRPALPLTQDEPSGQVEQWTVQLPTNAAGQFSFGQFQRTTYLVLSPFMHFPSFHYAALESVGFKTRLMGPSFCPAEPSRGNENPFRLVDCALAGHRPMIQLSFPLFRQTMIIARYRKRRPEQRVRATQRKPALDVQEPRRKIRVLGVSERISWRNPLAQDRCSAADTTRKCCRAR